MLKERKNVIRLICFLAAVAVAVISFTTGVLRIGHKDPGYYDVGLTAEGSSLLYGSGAHMLYYADGSGSAVRLMLNQAQKDFTAALTYAWQLLDARQTYPGMVNIASLNQSQGEPLQVGETLYGVLADAAERTDRGEGYSLFSGLLHGEWTSLRYLEEPQEADPLNNPDERALLAQMAELLRQPDTVSFTLTAPDTAAFSVSEACRSLMAEQELEMPVLDLNLLRDAYLLELTAQGLKARGYTAGYLYTDSGYSLWLEDSGDMRYELLAQTAEGTAPAAALNVPAPAAYCQFTAFPMTGQTYGYYTVEQPNRLYLRHPWITLAGDFADVLQTAGLASDRLPLHELGYIMAVINSLPTQTAVDAYLAGLPAGVFAAYTLQNGSKTFYTNAADRLTLYEESGYAIGE